MPTARDVADVFESIAPIETGIKGDELGFVYGDPHAEVHGIACVWNVHSGSLAGAAELGANFIICHESIWYFKQQSPWYDGPTDDEVYSSNIRRQALEKHQMTVYRSHSNWDALADDGVPDQAVAALGIGDLKVVGAQKFFKVHELPTPMTANELCQQAAIGLGHNGCQLYGDATKKISRFAFLIGGFGCNQYNMPQAARDLGAEAIIIGEMLEFIVIAALEMGMPVIETLHSVSEIPAIKRQAEVLAARFPGIPVHYVPSGALSFNVNH